MNSKSPILLYGRSPTNIILSLISITFIIGSTLLFKGIFQFILPFGIFLLYLVTTILILFSKKGAREIIDEREGKRVKRINKVITRHRELRDRISFLRIGNSEIREALEYFLLISGNYLNKCRELKSYSPEANSKISEVLKLCQIYLEEYNEKLTEKQYNIKDDDPFSEYEERTSQAIRDAADRIKVKMKEDFSGLTPREEMEIIEELNSE